MLHSAVQFLHAINLSEDNTLASLQAMWSVVHAGYHPGIALKLGPNDGKFCINCTIEK